MIVDHLETKKVAKIVEDLKEIKEIWKEIKLKPFFDIFVIYKS